MLWRFVREFPVDTQRPGARRVASVFVDVSFGVGVVLFTTNAIGWFGDSTMPAWLMALFELFDRDQAGTGLLAATVCHRGPRDSVSPVEDPARGVRRPPPRDALRRGAGGRTDSVRARGGRHAVRAGASGSVGAAACRRRPLRGARVDRSGYRLLRRGGPRDGFAVVSSASRCSTPWRGTRSGPSAWAARLRGVRHPRKPAVDHCRISRALPPRRTFRALHGGFGRPGISATSAPCHRPLVSSRAIRPVTDSRPARAAIPNGRQSAWRDQGARRGAEPGLHAMSVAVLLVNDDGTELVPVEGTTAPIRRDSALLEILRTTRGDVRLDSQTLGSIARLLPADGSGVAGRRWGPSLVPPCRVDRDAPGGGGDRRGSDRSAVHRRPTSHW